MADLTDAELIKVRAEVGFLDQAAIDAANVLQAVFANPYAVALQILNERLAYYESLAAKRSAAGDSEDHSKNISALKDKIGRLVSYIDTSGQALNTAAQDLVDRSRTGPADHTRTLPMVAKNRRRGG